MRIYDIFSKLYFRLTFKVFFKIYFKAIVCKDKLQMKILLISKKLINLSLLKVI